MKTNTFYGIFCYLRPEHQLFQRVTNRLISKYHKGNLKKGKQKLWKVIDFVDVKAYGKHV